MPNRKEKAAKAALVRKELQHRMEEIPIGEQSTLSVEDLALMEFKPRVEAQLSHTTDEDGNVTGYVGLTEARLTVFLQELAETDSLAAAARKATPWEMFTDGGIKTFTDYAETNPEFKEAIQIAKDFALGIVEHELVRRAFTPELKPIVSSGEVVGHQEKYDNKLLLRVAEKMAPEKWSQKHEVKHSGGITHGVMVVPGKAQTDDEWEDEYEGTEHPQLEVVEAELMEEGIKNEV